MIRFKKLDRDASLIRSLPLTNTGLSEILSLHDDYTHEQDSRIIFDVNGVDPNNLIELYMFVANIDINIKTINLILATITEEWKEGNGDLLISRYGTGVSWIERMPNVSWQVQGGTYDSQSTQTVELKHSKLDIVAPINQLMNHPDYNGILIFIDPTSVSSYLEKAYLEYYSSETHTIFVPYVVEYDYQYTYNPPADALILDSDQDFTIQLKTKEINGKTRLRMRIVPHNYNLNFEETFKPSYPLFILPDSVSISIVHKLSNTTILEHSDNTILSIDEDGYFIDLDFTDLSEVWINQAFEVRFHTVIDGTDRVLKNKRHNTFIIV